MSTLRWIAMLAGFALATFPGSVEGGDLPPSATVRANLEITAALDCATFASIATRVAKRSARIEFTDGGPGLPALQGKIGPISGAGRRVLVELTVLQPSGQTSRRKLTAPDCEQGAEALALLITLTLDPVIALGTKPNAPIEASESTVTTEPSTDRSSRAAINPRPARKPAPNRDEERSALSELEDPPPTKTPEPSFTSKPTTNIEKTPHSFAVSASLGILGSGVTGPSPRIMPGLGVYGFLAFDRSSLLSLALRLTVSHHRNRVTDAPGGTAHFAIDVASLDACVLRLTAGWASSRLCVTGQMGRLSASGSNTSDAQSHKRLFASTGGTVLFQVALPAAFEITGDVGLGLALTRKDFAFNPVTFYITPPQVFRFGLGMGRRW